LSGTEHVGLNIRAGGGVWEIGGSGNALKGRNHQKRKIPKRFAKGYTAVKAPGCAKNKKHDKRWNVGGEKPTRPPNVRSMSGVGRGRGREKSGGQSVIMIAKKPWNRREPNGT